MYIKVLLSIKTFISFWMKDCILITHICNLKIIKALKRNFIWVPHKVQKQTCFSTKKKGWGERRRERDSRQTTIPSATVSIN